MAGPDVSDASSLSSLSSELSSPHEILDEPDFDSVSAVNVAARTGHAVLEESRLAATTGTTGVVFSAGINALDVADDESSVLSDPPTDLQLTDDYGEEGKEVEEPVPKRTTDTRPEPVLKAELKDAVIVIPDDLDEGPTEETTGTEDTTRKLMEPPDQSAEGPRDERDENDESDAMQVVTKEEKNAPDGQEEGPVKCFEQGRKAEATGASALEAASKPEQIPTAAYSPKGQYKRPGTEAITARDLEDTAGDAREDPAPTDATHFLPKTTDQPVTRRSLACPSTLSSLTELSELSSSVSAVFSEATTPPEGADSSDPIILDTPEPSSPADTQPAHSQASLVNLAAPTAPVVPGTSIASTALTAPTAPTSPTVPSAPISPKAPTAPITPTASTAPTAPIALTAPGAPAALTASATPTVPLVTPLAEPQAASVLQQPLLLPPRRKRPIFIAMQTRSQFKVRPKASIPLNLSSQEYARQCIAAAESSRLNPYALHEEEYALLYEHVSHVHVSTYLNIRNGILRLWLRKPHLAITRSEAIGCARDVRWFDAASVCFDWLVRSGYINFGCVEFKNGHRGAHRESHKERSVSATTETNGSMPPSRRRKRIVVIGAGMAGLGCARQLQNLFYQYSDQLGELGEEAPEVVVLEGRNRVGGRVYSKAFQVQPQIRPPGFEHSRCTAEMGGMIITGFDRGNPINILVRGQLGLAYHALLSTTTLYDIDGQPVDAVRDGMVENLFNECLDRVSEYKYKLPVPSLVEGNRDHINEGRDGSSDGHRTIAAAGERVSAKKVATAPVPASLAASEVPAKLLPVTPLATPTPGASTPTATPSGMSPQPIDLVPVSSDRLTGRANLTLGTFATQNAARKLGIMGWPLRPGVVESQDLDLDLAAKTPGATLGFVVEEAIRQYRDLVELNAQDLRLLNWHIANLEYSNAINQNCLSLLGWDIDAGNEWEGKHSMVVGGYQSVPRGLMLCPSPLDVRRQMVVEKITYQDGAHASSGSPFPVSIACEGGQTFEADYVVSTLPLGVLKHGNVTFDPPLPHWKAGAIRRLGYGVLNKVILTFRQAFWDPERDIFGVLRAPANRISLDQKEYARRRGRLFQWFNVTRTTGIPCLVALMAGDAAYDTERTSNDDLVAEAVAVLRTVYGQQNVPAPIEAVVTRWASDPFARGSYSSAGPEMEMDDYDTMAAPVGDTLYFAGEHTTGTHPATVHGAYLSGLRAAAEVFDALAGPIQVPVPLVAAKEATTTPTGGLTVTPLLPRKRKAVLDDDGGEESGGSVSGSYRATKASTRQRQEVREAHVQAYICSQIGQRPERPARLPDTGYVLFSRMHFEKARKKCEEGRRPGKGRPTPNEVRVLTSKMWRSASAEERRPFEEQAAAQKKAYDAAMQAFNEQAEEWDRRAADVWTAYEQAHTDDSEHQQQQLGTGTQQSPSGGGRRLRRMASSQADGTSDVDVTTGNNMPLAM